MSDHEELADISVLVAKYSPTLACDILRLASVWRRQMVFLDDMVDDAMNAATAITDIDVGSNVLAFRRRA